MIFTRLQIFINILVVLSIFSVILSNYNDYDVVLIFMCYVCIKLLGHLFLNRSQSLFDTSSNRTCTFVVRKFPKVKFSPHANQYF